MRACVFFFFAAAVWGLLPLLVRHRLGLGPEAFGLLLGVDGRGRGRGRLRAAGAARRLPDRGAMVTASLVSARRAGAAGVAPHWLPAALAHAGYSAAPGSRPRSTLQAAGAARHPRLGAGARHRHLPAVLLRRDGGAARCWGAGPGERSGSRRRCCSRRRAAAVAAAGARLAPRCRAARPPTAPVVPCRGPRRRPRTARRAGRGFGPRCWRWCATRSTPPTARRSSPPCGKPRRVRLRGGALAWRLLRGRRPSRSLGRALGGGVLDRAPARGRAPDRGRPRHAGPRRGLPPRRGTARGGALPGGASVGTPRRVPRLMVSPISSGATT